MHRRDFLGTQVTRQMLLAPAAERVNGAFDVLEVFSFACIRPGTSTSGGRHVQYDDPSGPHLRSVQLGGQA